MLIETLDVVLGYRQLRHRGSSAGIGAVSVTRKRPTYIAFWPLFAAQQVAEGIVWRTIEDPDQATLQLISVAVFLDFALVVYPICRHCRSSWPSETLAAGDFFVYSTLLVSASRSTQAPCRSRSGRWPETPTRAAPLGTTRSGNSLVMTLCLPAYVLPTVTPFLISTMNKAKVMGGGLAFGLVATFVIKRQAVTSVRCFFAAVLSGVIVLSIAAEHRIGPIAAEHRRQPS